MSNLKDRLDFAEIESLYTVIEKVIGHSGKHVGILAVANERLAEIEVEAKVVRDEIMKAKEDERLRKEAEARDGVDNDGDGEIDENDEGEDAEDDDPSPTGARAIPSSTFDKSRRV